MYIDWTSQNSLWFAYLKHAHLTGLTIYLKDTLMYVSLFKRNFTQAKYENNFLQLNFLRSHNFIPFIFVESFYSMEPNKRIGSHNHTIIITSSQHILFDIDLIIINKLTRHDGQHNNRLTERAQKKTFKTRISLYTVLTIFVFFAFSIPIRLH